MKHQIFLPILTLLTFFVISCEEEIQFPGGVERRVALCWEVCAEGEGQQVSLVFKF